MMDLHTQKNTHLTLYRRQLVYRRVMYRIKKWQESRISRARLSDGFQQKKKEEEGETLTRSRSRIPSRPIACTHDSCIVYGVVFFRTLCRPLSGVLFDRYSVSRTVLHHGARRQRSRLDKDDEDVGERLPCPCPWESVSFCLSW